MATKKIIQRNLPLTDNYTLLSVTHGTEANCCANCGKLITNIATIKNQNNQIMFVGLDCAETLTGIAKTEKFEMLKYQFNKVSKFLSFAKDGIVTNYHNFTIEAVKNGKKVDCLYNELQKFAPNFIIPMMQ